MEKSIFFNSAPGDPRKYQASDFAGYFGTVLSSGLLHTDNSPALRVHCEGTDLRTYVNPGKAIIEGYFYENTSDLYLTHALPEATLPRIDRIVLRLDKRNQSRFIRLFVVQGVAAADPVAPALQRDDFIFELGIAEIRVRANTSSLVASDLVDTRLNESLCGLVYSLISIPTSQFQEQWDAFMEDVKDDGFATHDALNTHAGNESHVPHLGTTTNVGNAYSVDTLEAITANRKFTVKINAASTGAATLNINSSTAFGIKKPGGANATLKVGVYTLFFDGASFQLLGEGGDYGTAVAGDVRAGKTVGTENGVVNGTIQTFAADLVDSMPASSAIVYNGFGDGNLYALMAIPAGQIIGGNWVRAHQPDLIAANFRNDKTIMGLRGTMPVRAGIVPANGAAQWPDGGLAVYLPDGYYGGSPAGNEIKLTAAQLQIAVANLSAGNIRSGVTILGVPGNVVPNPPYIPGTNWVTPDLTGGFNNLTNWMMKAGITVAVGGTYRATFGWGTIFGPGNVYARLYVNGVPRGAVRTANSYQSSGSGTTTVYNEDIALNAGDELQMWGYVDSGSVSGNFYNFKIGITVQFAHTTRSL